MTAEPDMQIFSPGMYDEGAHCRQQEHISKWAEVIDPFTRYIIPGKHTRLIQHLPEGIEHTLVNVENRVGYIVCDRFKSNAMGAAFLSAMRAEITLINGTAMQAGVRHAVKI